MAARTLSDRELLEIELETLWERNAAGRLVKSAGSNGGLAPDLVVAIAGDVAIPAFGTDLPDALAKELGDLPSAEQPYLARTALVPGSEPLPSFIEDLRQRLSAALGPLEVASGPNYVCEAPPALPGLAGLIRSDDPSADFSRLAPPADAGWTAEEWELLLSSQLGPWAAVTVNGEVAALCFCARLTDLAAEAGVRTEPAHRRQGHAAAVTAAWAAQVLATGRVAFYSTSADNVASQGVAARLGLRPIGWIWQLSHATG